MTVLLIDGNNLTHACNYARRLTNSKGFPTHAIKGFLGSLFSYHELFNPTKAMVVWDGGTSAERLKIHPEYKKRDKDPESETYQDFRKQAPMIVKLLGMAGVEQVYGKGVEADDLIAYLIRGYSAAEKVVICSNDKDFYQLIDHQVSVYKTVKGGERHITAEEFYKKYGIDPSQWLDFRAMTGDASDNVLGCMGVGEKTAMSVMQRWPDAYTFRNDVLLGRYKPTALEKRIVTGWVSFEMSKRLMDLKTAAAGIHDMMFDVACGNNPDGVLEILNMLEFKSVLKNLHAWGDVLPALKAAAVVEERFDREVMKHIEGLKVDMKGMLS